MATGTTASPLLFLRNATHWQDFFAKRGKPVYLWADMLMHKSEVSPAAAHAPTAEHPGPAGGAVPAKWERARRRP